jgi:hypothetical protein
LFTPFSLAYVTTSYGYCCSYYTCSIRVEKEKEVATTEEHKKPASKRNPRNSKPRRRKTNKNMMLSTLNDKK